MSCDALNCVNSLVVLAPVSPDPDTSICCSTKYSVNGSRKNTESKVNNRTAAAAAAALLLYVPPTPERKRVMYIMAFTQYHTIPNVRKAFAYHGHSSVQGVWCGVSIVGGRQDPERKATDRVREEGALQRDVGGRPDAVRVEPRVRPEARAEGYVGALGDHRASRNH